jgi:hypothetical protein
MQAMKNFGYENQVAIRSTPAVVRELDRIVADMRASGRVRFKGRKITKEAVVNALILWVADQDQEAVEAVLAGPVARLEAILAGPGDRDDEGPGPGELGSVGEPIDLDDDGASGSPRDERERCG